MSPGFVHLRLHTEFSLVDGLVKIKPLVQRLVELDMPAVAVTDHCNLFALVKFHKAAVAAGIKPIAGADVWVANPDNPLSPHRLTLLVHRQDGYVALSELLAMAYRHGQYAGVPMLRREWLEERHHGLLALSGGMEGDIGRALLADHGGLALRLAARWRALFGDRFYLELQRVGRPDEERHIDAALELALAADLPVVATNDVRFLRQEDFAAHEVRVCINQGRVLDDPQRPRPYTDQQYLRGGEEMRALFADIPEALANSVAIAQRCTMGLALGKPFLPDYPVPEGMSLAQFLTAQAGEGLALRLRQRPPAGGDGQAATYQRRLADELAVINAMGFAGYFLIVADFIQWAKAQRIPVGPGRGSGAGSLVAYALSITDLDPIAFDLLFERFLNPERVSMPDFDIDFCMDRRDEVIQYVSGRYGRDRVAQIITYGSMAAKAVVRDVGRVLGLAYGFVDKLAKLVPFELGITLEKALRDSPDLKRRYDNEEEVQNLLAMAMALEGTARNAGKHAGGVVIAPSKLTDFTPLYCEEGGGNLVTQFDKDDVEAIGLVKFDFLGLRTLTIIDWALQAVNQKRRGLGEPPVAIDAIPLDDGKTYQLLKSARTTAVFQLESRGMKELIKKLKPDCFDDIIALVALFRPGPLESGMVDDYINVKHGAKAEYAHPLLAPILGPTNGVILYQEQVMQIAREMAGYTLGGADLLRRAMGKKKPEEMAKERHKFVSGAVAGGVAEPVASHIFDLMEKFAGYGFNKSHSAAYALVAYQTAWLKAHYPAEFMAAVLSSDMDNTDKVVVLVDECRQLGLRIQPPSVNRSEHKFTVNGQGQIVYGLGAIKGVGEAAVEEALISERELRGDYGGLYDLCKRVDLRKVNRRVLEALIKAGAFDEFNPCRAAHLAELPIALQVAEQHAQSRQTGQNDLFGLANDDGAGQARPAERYSATAEPWTPRQALEAEKATLGLYLSGHPLDQYQAELGQFTNGSIARIREMAERARGPLAGMRVAGLLVDMRLRQNKSGRPFVSITLDDRSGQLECVAFGETYEQYRDYWQRDQVLVVQGTARLDGFSNAVSLTIEKLYDITDARAAFAKGIAVDWRTDGEDGGQWVERLTGLLAKFKGGTCPLEIGYQAATARAVIRLGDAWRVHPADELIARLRNLPGVGTAQVKY